MRYAFIAEHRPVFSIRAMCRCLSVQPSGFYAWLKDPLSRRAREDERQTKLIRAAWRDSGKVELTRFHGLFTAWAGQVSS